MVQPSLMRARSPTTEWSTVHPLRTTQPSPMMLRLMLLLVILLGGRKRDMV